MIGTLAGRLGRHLSRRSAALRVAAVPVLQMGIAAALSWFVAHDLVGHTSTYFAPIASTIVLSVRPGPHTRRAFEMVVGIAVGIGVGDVIVREIGTGAIQIGLIVLLAVSAAIMIGAGPVIASQAAGTAVLVAAIPAPSAAPTRFEDALIGGLIGIGVLAVVPRNPVTQLRRTIEPFLGQIVAALRAAAAALESADGPAASAALRAATEMGGLGDSFDALLRQGRETALLAPIRWTLLPAVDRYVQAAPQVDSLGRDTRVLCRAVRTACETGSQVPAQLPAAIRRLADAVSQLAPLLAGGTDEGELIELALAAASGATAGLDGTGDLQVAVIVSCIRSSAVDLLRAIGVGRQDAQAHIRAGGV